MKNKNGEKAKYIYAKIMFSYLFHRTQRFYVPSNKYYLVDGTWFSHVR